MNAKTMYLGVWEEMDSSIVLSDVERAILALEEAEYHDDLHDTKDFTDTVYYGVENTIKLGFSSHTYTIEELEAQDKCMEELDNYDLDILENVWASFTQQRDYQYNR